MASAPQSLLGCIVRVPSAWGLVVEDVASEPHVRVVRNWTLAAAQRTETSVLRAEISERSFCPIGQCVETQFGSGVLLDFRCEDCCHVVRLWHPRGRGAGTLYCQASAIRRVLAGAVGFPATTPEGVGIVRAVEYTETGAFYRVEISDGQGGTSFISVAEETMHSPAAATLPVAESFGRLAEQEIAKYMWKAFNVVQEQDFPSVQASELLAGAGDLLRGGSASSSSAAGSVLAGGVQKVSQHLGFAQTEIREDGTSLHAGLFQSAEMRALSDKLQDTQMGHVLMHGAERLREHAVAIQDAGTPQVERVKLRACELALTLTEEDVLREKAHHLLIGAWQVVDDKLALYSPVLVREAGNLASVVANHCTGIVQQAGALLSARVELGLAGAIAASNADPALAGSELLDRFRMIGSEPAKVASVPAGQTLAMLDALGLELPTPARDTMVRDASQPLDTAVADILDCEDLALRAEGILKKGEAIMDGVHKLATSTVVAGVLENLESSSLERELLEGFKRFDTAAFLHDADRAVSDREARETFVNRILDVCLDFLLRTLPSIRIPHVSGTHLGTAFQVHDLDLSGIRFQKEDVHISLGELKGAGSAVLAQGEVELLQLSALRVSGEFSELQCKVKPPLLPETSVSMSGIASGIALDLHFAAKFDSESSTVSVRISKLAIRMESLKLKLTQTNYAGLLNPLVSHLTEFLMGYICGVLESRLIKPLSTLCTGLSELLTEIKPLLALFGWPPRSCLDHKTNLSTI